MKTGLTREHKIMHAFIVHNNTIKDVGLLHGKMGIVLCSFHIGRVNDNNAFTLFAEDMLNKVIESLHKNIPIDFENGVTGIGWAVEYLIQNEFIEANADEVLEEIDEKVFKTLLYKENVIDDTLSMIHYLISRMCYRIDENTNEYVEEIKYNITLLIDILKQKIASKGVNEEIIYALSELSNLNIFNDKIGVLCRITEEYNHNFIFPKIIRYTREQLDEIMNLKEEQTKYAGFDLSHIIDSNRWGLREGIAGIGLQNILIK